MNGPTSAQENWFVHSGRSMFAHVVAAPPVGKLFIRLASKFPEKEDNDTLPCVEATHAGLFANDVQSVARAEGKFVTRDASIFPENPANVTDDCVEATHDGLFKSVFQSGVGATGKFVTRDAGSEPAKFSSHNEFWVGADVALIQPASARYWLVCLGAR